MDYIYPDYLCDGEDPRADQPEGVLLGLKPHQLTSIHKMMLMESQSNVVYNVNGLRWTVADATVGILADRPGYGKTLTVLGLIASNDNIVYPSNRQVISRDLWAGQNYSVRHEIREPENYNPEFITATLIVAPHGPVFQQWLTAITTSTTLTCFAVGKTADLKHVPTALQPAKEFLSGFDIVLVSGTYYPALRQHTLQPGLKYWKRVVIDEAHSIVTGRRRMVEVTSRFAWFVTGTPANLMYPSSTGYIRYSWPYMHEHYKYLTVRNKEEYVVQSFTLPPNIVRQYICKDMYRLDTVRGFASPAVMEMLNANDLTSALGALNGRDGDDIMELIAKDLKTDIANKKIEIEAVERQILAERDKRLRLERLTGDLNSMEERYKNIKERLESFEEHECSICCCNFTDPVTLQCTHVFCGECILKWVKMQMNRRPLCPECKDPINLSAIVRLTGEAASSSSEARPTMPQLTKDEVVLHLIKSRPEAKFLVFAKHDGCFYKLKTMLDAQHIPSKQLKGQPSYQNKVLDDFKSGALRVIMLNSRYSGSGIDLHYASDIVLYQKFDEGTTTQVVARADRVGRTSQLNIHKLYHSNELDPTVAATSGDFIRVVDHESIDA